MALLLLQAIAAMLCGALCAVAWSSPMSMCQLLFHQPKRAQDPGASGPGLRSPRAQAPRTGGAQDPGAPGPRSPRTQARGSTGPRTPRAQERGGLGPRNPRAQDLVVTQEPQGPRLRRCGATQPWQWCSHCHTISLLLSGTW